MEAFARLPAAAARGIAFVEPDEVKERNPAVAGQLTGGLHGGLDAVVEPRRALGALRDHLGRMAPARYRFHPGHRVVAAEPGGTFVDTTGTRWSGDLAVVATGADYDHLPGTAAPAERLQRVRLQMFETEPFGATLTTSIADADTLRYYPAFAAAPLAALGSQGPVGGGAPHAAAAGAAARRRPHRRRHPRLRRALRLRPERGPDKRADGAGGPDPRRGPLPPVRRRWEGVYAQRARRRGVPARGDRRARRPGHRSRRAWHDLCSGHRRRTRSRRRVSPFRRDRPVRAGLPRYGRHDRARRRRGRGRVRGRPPRRRGSFPARRAAAEASAMVRATMGWSKADVFAALLHPEEAARATAEFARAYEASSPPAAPSRSPARSACCVSSAPGASGLSHYRLRAVDPRRPARRVWPGRPRSTWRSRRPTSAVVGRPPT